MELLFSGFIASLLHIVQPFTDTHAITINVKDTTCITEAIYYEARSEQLNASNVAYVILNRAAETNQSPCQVVHQSHQFSYLTQPHNKIKEVTAWKLSAYIAVYTQLGLIPNHIGNATSYNERPVDSWLFTHRLTHHIGHFYFYRKQSIPEYPPLVMSDNIDTPTIPRVIMCDSVDVTKFHRTGWSRPSTFDTVSTVQNTPQLHQVDKTYVTMWIPPSIPFPGESALPLAQTISLVEIFKHQKPLSLQSATHPVKRNSIKAYHKKAIRQIKYATK